MKRTSVVVLGGGLAGIATAHALARAGYREISVVERGLRLGGLAGSFEQGGRSYPLGYHHILHRDRTLLFFLDQIAALPRVLWRSIRMLFQRDGRFFDLANPTDFWRFPLPFVDKLCFVRLMAYAAVRSDWRSWNQRSAAALIDRLASPGVRAALFEPLTQLKFQLPCDAVSGAWLGARLHYREGAAPLGYIPETNWTTLLCDGLTDLLVGDGVAIHTGRQITGLRRGGDRILAAELDDGTVLGADLFVSALPVEIYLQLAPEEVAPELRSINYTALLSAICATDQRLDPEFYWLNLSSLKQRACAVFTLSALNPSIGQPGETCLNFVTHLTRNDPMFGQTDDHVIHQYREDFRDLFGFELKDKWMRLVRVPMYSPIFRVGYRNPAVRSERYRNLFFTGNYRTYPSVASTGTALSSGLDTASAILAVAGQTSAVVEDAHAFRPPAMVRVG